VARDQEVQRPNTSKRKSTRAKKIWTVRSRGTRGGNPLSSGETTSGENECAGETLEELKWIMAVKSRRTRVDRLCISGESTLGESECREFGTPEARSPEIDLDR